MFTDSLGNSTRFSATALLGALLATVSAAQSVAVFPFDHASREGAASITNRPLSAGVSRVQIVYSRFRLGIPNGAQIRRIGFRPDVAGTGAGRQVQLEVAMGHASASTLNTTVSTTFASNYSDTPILVYTPKMLTLPTVAAVAQGPQTSYVWIPLDVPFTYDASRNLVVEYRVAANSNGNAAFSYALDAGAVVSEPETFAAGCQTSGARVPQQTCATATVGANWTHTIANGPANTAGVLFVGGSKTMFLGAPLPLPLDAFGARGCVLAVAMDMTLPFASGSNGGANVSVPVPAVGFLAGRSFFGQSLLIDVFANAAGYVTTNGCGASVGIAPQATAVVATGSTTAQTGARSNGFGLVSVFEY